MLQRGLDAISSVTIGINFDAQLNPVQATLLSINDKRFSGASLLGKLFSGGSDYQGISELYAEPDFVAANRTTKEEALLNDDLADIQLRQTLFRDLRKVLKASLKPIRPTIELYSELRFQWILALEADIAFYAGAVRFVHRMRELGLPMCRPVVLPIEQRKARLEGNYNLPLALKMSTAADGDAAKRIVANDVRFDDQGRIFILSGPNSGGKTTCTQAIGLTQALMQVGLYVPCVKAELSPVDGFYPYFNVEEDAGLETGRLGVESRRIGDIIRSSTPYSLILLNESFSSTSPGESLYLMQDIVCALKLLGLRAVIATHLHELAENIDRINAENEGDGLLVSMIAGMREESGEPSSSLSNRSYKVTRGRPQGQSFARDIARQYGISLEQLKQTISDRRLPPPRL